MATNDYKRELIMPVSRQLRSGLNKIISSAKRINLIYQCIHRYGLERSLWVLSYVEETLGGYESFMRKFPVDSKGNPLPWYTYPAIEYLQQLDFSKCRIFEYGSGNSSRFWSHQAAMIMSVESDPDWYESGIRELSPNQTLLLRTEKELYVSAIQIKNDVFDMVVIDGAYRFNCAIEAVKRIRRGGFIVLDNSDWYPNTARLLRDSGLTQVDFIGTGPINSYAWCTSLFFNGQLDIPRKIEDKAIQVLGGLIEISKEDNLV